MSPTTSWLVLGVGIALVVGVVIWLSVRETLDPGGSGVTDELAWDLPALDESADPGGDGRVALAEFEGTPTVVNFFASWCTSCDRELPVFRDFALALEGEVDFVFAHPEHGILLMEVRLGKGLESPIRRRGAASDRWERTGGLVPRTTGGNTLRPRRSRPSSRGPNPPGRTPTGRAAPA